MEGKRYSIDAFKKELTGKTPIEKIDFINQKLKFFREWQYKDGKDYTGTIFEFGFYEQAEVLLKEIENDNADFYSNDWNYYFNADNIPNQEAVFATKDFLETERKDVFEPLFFFNLLFKQKDNLKDSLDTPIDFITHLKALPYTEEQKYLLLGMLLYWFGGYPVNNGNPKYNTILKLAEREFLKMFPGKQTPEKSFCSNLQERKEIKEAEMQINEVINPKKQYDIRESKYLDKIDIDLSELPQYIVQKGIIWRFERVSLKDDEYDSWKADWLKFLGTIPEQYIIRTVVKGIEFAKKAYEYHLQNECADKQKCIYNESWERRIAIAELVKNKLIAETQPKEEPEEKTTNPEFTTARQVMAMHYLFEYCQVKNVDNTSKARFIQFLTGKEAGASMIKNTTIYKKVAKPFSTDNKTLNTDLQYIRKHFEDLGLNEIAKMITNEISKSEN